MVVEVETKPCPGCRRVDTYEVTPEELALWAQHAHVQVAFPNLTPSQREQLITGYCAGCWERLMGPEE